MGEKLSGWLHRISRGWVVLAVVAIFVLFTALFLPGQGTQTDASGNDVVIPDLSFIHSVADLYGMAEAYGPEGRVEYVRARFTFDVAWPVVYTALLVTTISWFSRRAFAGDSLWQRVNLLPLLAALFDFLENVSVSLVMMRYPVRTPVVDVLATLFTPVKWLLVGVCCGLLLVCIGVNIWRRVHRTR